jgi:hypothetical protein
MRFYGAEESERKQSTDSAQEVVGAATSVEYFAIDPRRFLFSEPFGFIDFECGGKGLEKDSHKCVIRGKEAKDLFGNLQVVFRGRSG